LVYLPFYVVGSQYRKKSYQIVVNGQTGVVAGRYPLSGVKILFTIIFLLALLLIGLRFVGVI
jgi:hypothetical protein